MMAAFIVMSILGCDDAGEKCLPVATVDQQWQTIAACDAASEKHLAKYVNVNYPMVVAVCQTANTTALADSEEEIAVLPAAPVIPEPPIRTKTQQAGMTSRAIALFMYAIPTKQALKDTVEKPVHFVSDSYSWVARKITD